MCDISQIKLKNWSVQSGELLRAHLKEWDGSKVWLIVVVYTYTIYIIYSL